jgi:hypothetical protein
MVASSPQMTLKLTGLHPFAGNAEFKTAVAEWRELAAPLRKTTKYSR